jgi:predicted SnoaL-like aldol condensation-catalyzing enzyme
MSRAKFVVLALAMLFCGGAHAGTTDKPACETSTENSRKLVLAFYNQALVDKEVRPAFERYVSPGFVEHKPDVPGGTRDAVIDFLEGLVKELPDARWEILRSVAEDDLVFLHARFSPAPGAPPYAIADLFRIEHCAIVEHWDVVGPPREGQPNTNSRF